MSCMTRPLFLYVLGIFKSMYVCSHVDVHVCVCVCVYRCISMHACVCVGVCVAIVIVCVCVVYMYGVMHKVKCTVGQLELHLDSLHLKVAFD